MSIDPDVEVTEPLRKIMPSLLAALDAEFPVMEIFPVVEEIAASA